MKISDLLKVVDKGWIRKPEGFRVRFQTRVDGNWVTDTMPGKGQSLLDSDIVAWRSAWKLWQAAQSGAGEYVNITVVDDRGEPLRYYATGAFEVFNRRDDAVDAPDVRIPSGPPAEAGETFAEGQPGSGGEAGEEPAGSDPTEK